MQYTTNLGLNKPDPNDYADIAKINENMDKIDALVLMAVAAAAAYDPEGSYAVGDYCTHGGKLHKCGTEIPDGEPWTAEHWTETSVAAELAEVHSLLAPLGGATTAQAALAAMGAGVRPNLLDNAIFVGGGTAGNLPINQRGQSEYEGNTYTIDRWFSSNSRGVVTVLEDCVKLTSISTTSYFRQMLKKIIPAGEIWTLSAIVKCVGSGYIGFTDYKGTDTTIKTQSCSNNDWDIITCTLDGTQDLDADSVTIRCDTPTSEIMLKAAKLEPGIMQTLGYKDETGVHMFPQPESDYATQLAKCQRYLYKIAGLISSTANIIGTGYMGSSTQARIFIPLPTTMRFCGTTTKPTIEFNNLTARCGNSANKDYPVTYITPQWEVTPHGINVFCTVESNAVVGDLAILRLSGESGYLIIDATL